MKRSSFLFFITMVFGLMFLFFPGKENVGTLVCAGMTFILLSLAKICAQLEDNRRG